MPLLYALLSIFFITSLVHRANKSLPFRICPICAGVSGTWLIMLVLRFLGYSVPGVLLSLLMGGSVVGLGYQLEKRLPPGRSALIFKTLFFCGGFTIVYGIVLMNWFLAAAALLALLLIILLFFLPTQSPVEAPAGDSVKQLEKQLEDCC